ncbi:MAG TPA: ABC transporter substrate-binding protein [Candidatus Angelobacter sp.]|jgi:ABC-type transport system substrate-binding protein|nr:ABC transporter substrate-binding protein [Candidatus Angelobacter sp.]
MSEIFRVGFVNRWERRDPRTGLNYASFLVQGHIYQPPYHLTPGSNQIKAVLLDYPLQREPDEGGLVFSARMCSGIRFSDGTPLTADHIAESLEKTPAFKSQASALARGGRVYFRLKRPNARFELLLARFDLGIVLERSGELLGTGPYMLGPSPQPECFRLVRNPHSKEAPHLPEIECRAYPLDADGRRKKLLEAVNRGEVDFTDELARDEINRVERMRKCIDLGYCTSILFFNTEQPIFQDNRVRTAFASAIDRKSLAAQSYSNALAFAATGLVPPALGSAPDLMMHDLIRAKNLLAEAKASPTAPLVLVVLPVPRPYLPEPRATAELIAAQLKEVGFHIDIKHPRDLTEYQDICQRGGYDLLLAGWIPDTSDPVDFMESLLASHAVPSRSNQATRGSNLSRWRNAAFDEALQKQRVKPEPANWLRICELVRSEAPLFPLMYGPRIAVVSWRARNFPRDFGSGPFLAHVEVPDSAFAQPERIGRAGDRVIR